MTNSINLAALGFGGIDTSTLVSSLVSLAGQPITQLQSQQQNIQNASSTISSFSSALSSLATAATTLSDPLSFGGMAASSSSTAVAATVNGSPVAGQWTVSVSQVAQNQRTMTNGTSDTTSALGLSGTLNVTAGSGSPVGINVTSTMSLSDISNAIAAAGLPVQSSVFYDGSQYHLMVSGQNTGAANALTFDESGLSGSGYSLGLSTSSNTLQVAQDAKLSIGGVAVTSASNLVSNAIPGVNLALTQPTSTPTTITISNDENALANQVQSFITAYNDVVNLGHQDAGYATTNAANTLLQGDTAINSSLDQIAQLVANQVSGATGTYSTLASVGINLNSDGTLAFDATKFSAAVQADPASVKSLFVKDANTGSTGVMSSLFGAIQSLTDPTSGMITAELNAFSSRNTAIGAQVTEMQLRVTNYQTQIQNEFNNMNAQLAQYKNIAQQLNYATNTNNSSNNNSVL